MIENAIDKLCYLCDIIPGLLNNTADITFNEKTSPDKWSKKEIIGHLIDSATNNHQRFVRAQFEDNPSIAYDQNQWNACNYYQDIDRKQIIDFWTIYNKQLLELFRRIPAEHLQRTCMIKGQMLTLDFLINDYVAHLEHHLRQVVSY